MASRVLSSRSHTGTYHRTYNQRTACLATKHIAQFGALVEDHVPADAVEVDKHQFGDGAQTRSSGTYRRANKACFSNGRVKNALATKLLHQSFGDAQHTAPGIVLLKGC